MILGPCDFHLDRYKQEVPAIRVVAGSRMCADCFSGSGEDEPAERIIRPRKKPEPPAPSVGGPVRQALARLIKGTAHEVKHEIRKGDNPRKVQRVFHEQASRLGIKVTTTHRGFYLWVKLREEQ